MIRTEETFYEEAKAYAATCIDNIREMLAKLEHARECDGEEINGEPCEHKDDAEWHNEDEAQQAIDDDPLSIQVRDGWKTPGADSDGPEEFEILLTTGGPAARLIGELDSICQPDNVRFQYQDWFKPWTEVILDSADRAVLQEYAQRFYFGG